MSTFFLYFSKNFPNVCNVYYFFTSNKIRDCISHRGSNTRKTTFMKRFLLLISLLLATVTTMAQSKIDSIAYRALQVGKVMQQERVFLHFDNTAYYLGETIWFKAYVMFGTDDRPSTLSKVLYVELVAPEGYIVETKKYKLDEKGSCHGEFDLNPLLLSGYYEIRAYTRYMLNWSKEAVFSRVFPIFDKVNADNWDFKNMLDRKRGFNEKGKWVSAELPEATLDFFPEGGNLVAGLESHVAYELRENDGLFSEEKISIYEDGKLLLESNPRHMGKGVFTITPKKQANYRAEASIKNKKGKIETFKFDLPEVQEEGVVMHITEEGDSINISITNNIPKDSILGFAILYRGTMGFYKKLHTNEKIARYSIAKNNLPEGVNRAVLFADEKRPLAERQFFVQHDELQKSGRETVKLKVTANGYHVHNLDAKANEKITLKVSREDGKPIPDNSDLSLSVGDAMGTQKTSYRYNMYSYLLLGSELKGYIPDASKYFDPDNANRKEQLDLIMLTHGWTSYDWHMLARDEIKDMQPIERGITVKGKFYQKYRRKVKSGDTKLSVVPQKYNLTRLDIATDGKNVTTTTFRTDSTGSFVIELDDFYGTRIASMHPQTTFKHSDNISYQFALDRYYSPGFRLYDYWERHLGEPMSKNKADSLVRMNPFEYMLSSLEVVADRKKEINSRPPHSEMRFNYLDEWEYAQDVTYLDQFGTYDDELFRDAVDDMHLQEEIITEEQVDAQNSALERNEPIENNEIISLQLKDSTALSGITKYIGSIRYGKETITLPVKHEYDHTLTANDVVLSAMKRHNYGWAYWVQLMVVMGEYSPNSTPEPDKEYLRGIPDVDKMTNFKEFVIRSDEKTRKQFENRDIHWTPLSRMMDNKVPVQKFYKGFLSQSYLFAGDGIDGCPDSRIFFERIDMRQGIAYPMNPNYVACMIPYTEEERNSGIVPEFAATGSSMRYTSILGYSESKKFYSPNYSNMKPQEEDYRRTLLWVPIIEIKDGEATIELYNSSNCRNINVAVAGRDGVSIYSNDEGFHTRLHKEKKTKIEQTGSNTDRSNADTNNDEQYINVEMDSVLKAQCDYEHEKGIIFYNQKRYKNAITIFAELVQYKYAPAMYYIAMCYRDGTGLAVNNKLAIKFFIEAAKNGDAKAQHDLATILEEGKIVERDTAEAHTWFRRAAMQKEPRAMVEIAKRHMKGYMVELSKEKAEELLREAAQLQYPIGMHEYGLFLIDNGNEGLEYIKAAASHKHEEALIYMLEHEHSTGNFKAAYQYAKELHLIGNSHGTKRMADYYYEGKGISRDKGLAKDLYREAANAGNEEASRILKEL